MNQKVVTVTCHKIDPIHMFFQCPYCKSSYTKTGKARKNAFPVIHTHPSQNNPFNRTLEHDSKCHNFLQPDQPRHFKIIIDDTTRRCGYPMYPQQGSDDDNEQIN